MAPVAPMVEFSGSVMEQSAKTFPPDRKSSGFKSAKEELFADIELLQALVERGLERAESHHRPWRSGIFYVIGRLKLPNRQQ